MLRSGDGVTYGGIEENGGMMGFGWGASRAMPAARFQQVSDPLLIPVAGGGDTVRVSSLGVPSYGPADSHPWVSAQTPPDAAAAGTGGSIGTATKDEQTIMSFLSSMFDKAFGTSNAGAATVPDQGAVVVYGTTAGGTPSMGPVFAILLIAVVGFFAWQKWGPK